MVIGVELAKLGGYPFEVRHSAGALTRARSAAEITADAYLYLQLLFEGVEPDIALIVADQMDWPSRQPYGLPFFSNDGDQIRPGILVMPARSGDFWVAISEDLRHVSPRGFRRILATYPDGHGGVDLQPFVDLVAVHELGHAFEISGELKLPTLWLGEIFANLALHAFVATRRPDSLETLQVLSEVGAGSKRLAVRMRAKGYTTLEDLERHYSGGNNPMDPHNYLWYQYRWQRIAAAMFDAEGETSLIRFWTYFRGSYRIPADEMTAAALVPLLTTEVSEVLGKAIEQWD
jgi:hypothetical protein